MCYHDMNMEGDQADFVPEENADADKNGQTSDGLIERRRFLAVGGLGLLAVATSSCSLPGLEFGFPTSNEDPSVAENVRKEAKEDLVESTTEFGFTQHLTVVDTETDNQNPALFRKCVDRLAASGQQLLRTHIHEWEVVRMDDAGTLTWNEENLEKYKREIEYAQSKGLKMCLISAVPSPSKHLDDATYLRVTREFFARMGSEFAGLADTWQLFNEPDMHNIQDYNEVRQPDDFKGFFANRGQLGFTVEAIKAAAEGIKSTDPNAKTAVNFATTHFKNRAYGIISYFCDQLGDDLDEIQHDLYPGPGEIEHIPEYIAYFKKKYPDKLVSVGEMGYSTFMGGSGKIQAHLIGNMLEVLSEAEYRPDKVYVYSMTDRGSLDPSWDKSLGVLDVNGNPKGGEEAWEEITSKMVSEDESDQEGDSQK